MAKDREFKEAREVVIENLETIQENLVRCVAEGMPDPEAYLYNELLDLLDDAGMIKTWDELLEVVTKAKTLEIDVASWFSRHGRTSLSLPWPRAPKEA